VKVIVLDGKKYGLPVSEELIEELERAGFTIVDIDD
jgi:hypothetical protein